MRAAQTALTLEQGRLLKLKELEEANRTLIMTSNMVFARICYVFKSHVLLPSLKKCLSL